MKVITLDDDGFDNACAELASRLADKGSYDAIVGVRTGGAVVAAKVYEMLLQSDKNIKFTLPHFYGFSVYRVSKIQRSNCG